MAAEGGVVAEINIAVDAAVDSMQQKLMQRKKQT
jgi:hypothetical protein